MLSGLRTIDALFRTFHAISRMFNYGLRTSFAGLLRVILIVRYRKVQNIYIRLAKLLLQLILFICLFIYLFNSLISLSEVTVGMLGNRHSRVDPYVRNSLIRLLPRVLAKTDFVFAHHQVQTMSLFGIVPDGRLSASVPLG